MFDLLVRNNRIVVVEMLADPAIVRGSGPKCSDHGGEHRRRVSGSHAPGPASRSAYGTPGSLLGPSWRLVVHSPISGMGDEDVDQPEPPSAMAITALLREARSLSRRADELSDTGAVPGPAARGDTPPRTRKPSRPRVRPTAPGVHHAEQRSSGGRSPASSTRPGHRLCSSRARHPPMTSSPIWPGGSWVVRHRAGPPITVAVVASDPRRPLVGRRSPEVVCHVTDGPRRTDPVRRAPR